MLDKISGTPGHIGALNDAVDMEILLTKLELKFGPTVASSWRAKYRNSKSVERLIASWSRHGLVSSSKRFRKPALQRLLHPGPANEVFAGSQYLLDSYCSGAHSALETLVLMELNSREGQRGIFPSQSTIAADLGVSEASVQRALRSLTGRGDVKVDLMPGKRHNCYLICGSARMKSTSLTSQASHGWVAVQPGLSVFRFSTASVKTTELTSLNNGRPTVLMPMNQGREDQIDKQASSKAAGSAELSSEEHVGQERFIAPPMPELKGLTQVHGRQHPWVDDSSGESVTGVGTPANSPVSMFSRDLVKTTRLRPPGAFKSTDLTPYNQLQENQQQQRALSKSPGWKKTSQKQRARHELQTPSQRSEIDQSNGGHLRLQDLLHSYVTTDRNGRPIVPPDWVEAHPDYEITAKVGAVADWDLPWIEKELRRMKNTGKTPLESYAFFVCVLGAKREGFRSGRKAVPESGGASQNGRETHCRRTEESVLRQRLSSFRKFNATLFVSGDPATASIENVLESGISTLQHPQFDPEFCDECLDAIKREVVEIIRTTSTEEKLASLRKQTELEINKKRWTMTASQFKALEAQCINAELLASVGLAGFGGLAN